MSSVAVAWGAHSTTFNFSKAAVVMVDANGLCLEVTTGILTGFGFRRFHRCLALAEATEVVKSYPADLLLLDPAPYGESAFEFVRWLRSERLGPNSTVPIVMMSSSTHMRLISAARNCGADYVVAKPFSTSALLERILWVAENEGRRGTLIHAPNLVSNEGSGVEVW
jgi:DNA-binding response OmpR family regulator